MLIWFLFAANPNVFNFYVYLRTHPLLIRLYLASGFQDKKKPLVVLSGFSYNTDSKAKCTADRQVCILIVLEEGLVKRNGHLRILYISLAILGRYHHSVRETAVLYHRSCSFQSRLSSFSFGGVIKTA